MNTAIPLNHFPEPQMKHGLNTDYRSVECMKHLDQSIVPSALSPELAALARSLRHQLWRCELALLGAILVALNLPLFTGGFSTRFIYHPVPLATGEWWRLFTHPFVHVSPYHLALDAAAFFLAYVELQHRRLSHRFLLLASSAAGGLLATLAASPLVLTHGLCGLSGIAHGLTDVVSLELLRRANDRTSEWTAALCFIGVVAKSVLEAATGNVLFASWHLGSLGTPIAACHAGGVLGALVCWQLLAMRPAELGTRHDHDASAACNERSSSATCAGSSRVWAISSRSSSRYRFRSRCTATRTAPSSNPRDSAASA
jgi:rhomboid family GlyGly-CTERM serine protease